MNMKNWFEEVVKTEKKRAMPILSFPAIELMGITVQQLISDSDLQAKGMKAIADRCDTLAAVSMMDLSLEAQAFGASIKVSDHEVPTVTDCLIKTMEDAENLKVPAVGAGRTGIYVEAMKKSCELITDRPVFAGVIGPFSLSARLIDMTQIMLACFKKPEMVELVLDKATAFLIDYCNAYKQAGASGIMMAEPAAGLLSPKFIERFSTPYVKKIVDAVQTDDFAVVYHNCGNTIALIESIKTIGAFGYHFGNAIEMSKMLEIVPSDMIVMGNINPAAEFHAGTPQSIYEATTEVLKACSKYPNYIPSSGCDIPPQAPWENIDAFFKAVNDFYSQK